MEWMERQCSSGRKSMNILDGEEEEETKPTVDQHFLQNDFSRTKLDSTDDVSHKQMPNNRNVLIGSVCLFTVLIQISIWYKRSELRL